MGRLSGFRTDVTTVFGRVVSILRKDLRLSQLQLADELRLDRSLLTRVEIGRNIATIDVMAKLEEYFLNEEVLTDHGDLMTLTSRVAEALQRRGAQVVYGKAGPSDQVALLDLGILDRVAARVVDRWMEEVEEDDEDGDEEDEYGYED